ncbi:MAG: hypothetical protein AAF989_16030 [Planctomycetota bacterium]
MDADPDDLAVVNMQVNEEQSRELVRAERRQLTKPGRCEETTVVGGTEILLRSVSGRIAEDSTAELIFEIVDFQQAVE